jgi:hypothetical protein
MSRESRVVTAEQARTLTLRSGASECRKGPDFVDANAPRKPRAVCATDADVGFASARESAWVSGLESAWVSGLGSVWVSPWV